ncbi:hypothetical protein [Mycolicibacterium smegmatis]|uniref:hypothetical protein n=1 Tax=Mycolicibacterium smegmatis TaxID=1772 RepID=UPI001EFC0284|nr:hypothetical protein [Mycolicibacterium smegmatis]ULN32655.1 hypothetical protein KZ781_17225 [Mycolicibacterium smegmatis]
MTDPGYPPLPSVAVLEVSGAVLSWIVDEEPSTAPEISFTDPLRADWLWRVVGEQAHVAVVEGRTADLQVLPGSTDALRRLALGHWLRRWWPASIRDGIAELDPALLDAEIALSTVAAEEFFTDDTIDSDVAGLLAPHTARLDALAAEGDPRVTALIDRCRDLAAEIGVDWTATVPVGPVRRADYALAAGSRTSRQDAIAGGVATVRWSAVPPGIFDAAEDTVEWSVRSDGGAVDVVVQVALSGPGHADGIPVTVRCGDHGGAGVLAADGRAEIPMVTGGRPTTETEAWNQDWSTAVVHVGATAGPDEDARTRARVRAFARARLAAPTADAYLAEILAAESDY